jgi:hypothetical protein
MDETYKASQAEIEEHANSEDFNMESEVIVDVDTESVKE